jgi:hypothetical protein
MRSARALPTRALFSAFGSRYVRHQHARGFWFGHRITRRSSNRSWVAGCTLTLISIGCSQGVRPSFEYATHASLQVAGRGAQEASLHSSASLPAPECLPHRGPVLSDRARPSLLRRRDFPWAGRDAEACAAPCIRATAASRVDERTQRVDTASSSQDKPPAAGLAPGPQGQPPPVPRPHTIRRPSTTGPARLQHHAPARLIPATDRVGTGRAHRTCA